MISLRCAFKIAGFIFSFFIPVLMFGGIIPYTRDESASGFTTMGYIALAVVLAVVASKVKAKIKTRPESLKRGILLSLFPLGIWAVVKIGVNKIVALVSNIALYWNQVLVFVIIGSLFYIAAEAMGERNNEK